MDYFWKENRKFVLAVGGGLVAVLLYQGLVLSPLRSKGAAAQRRRQQERQALEEELKKGLPGEDALAAARRDRELARKQLGAMATEAAFRVPDRFRKPEKENPKAYYDGLKEDLKDELQKKAVQARLALPPGLGLQEGDSDDSAEEQLLRLAIVERLVLLAVEAGVEKIDSFDLRRYAAEEDRPDPRDRGHDPKGKDRQVPFLQRTAVGVRMSGKPEALFRMLHGVQKKGSYLAVTAFDASRPDPTRDAFEGTMTVNLIRVDEKGPLTTVEARR
jgi:hypothetical protein